MSAADSGQAPVRLQTPSAMVNYRRVLDVVVLLAAAACVAAAPCKDDRVYDQRQNGTENYRLNIDGVVIAIAPAESLLSAVSDIDLSDLIGDLDSFEQDFKPKPPSDSDFLSGEHPSPKPDDKPEPPKPEDKPSEVKPLEAKPDEKPENYQPEKAKPEAPIKAPETQSEKGHKKSAGLRKQENTQRLKHRLASIFLPFLRKRRHQ